jgi:hypothetical protein
VILKNANLSLALITMQIHTHIDLLTPGAARKRAGFAAFRMKGTVSWFKGE